MAYRLINQEQWTAVIAQAQVYASAWSMVGGPFDFGNALETARDEEKQLIGMFNNLPAMTASFQNRVEPWMLQCFGPEISADKLERGDRLLEEVLELLQSGDYPQERVAALVEYTWNRPKGEPTQEVGGVMVTLAAYCLALGIDMHDAGEVELARIFQPEIVEKIRAKQAKKASEIPFSALPVATRTPKDYAIEHAGYMATTAKQFLEYLNEVSDEEEGHIVPDDRFGDHASTLRSHIYEFEKRRDRALGKAA